MTTPSHNLHKWTDHEKQVNCNICLLADGMKNCKACPFYIAPKRLKSFEHGDTFITLEKRLDTYTVSLYLNRRADTGLYVTPDRSLNTTVLDYALDVYSKMCQHAVKLSGV